MTHTEAEALGAVEKYLLNEMSPDQRDAFEEHYFECGRCAADLRALSATIDGIRAGVVRRRDGSESKLWRWIERPEAARAAFACSLVLAGVLAYQRLVVMPRMAADAEQPRLIQTLAANLDRRGGGGSGGSAVYRLPVKFPPGFSSYRIEVRNEGGKVLQEMAVSAAEAESSEGIAWRRRAAGTVQLIVFGLNAGFSGQELDRRSFHIP